MSAVVEHGVAGASRNGADERTRAEDGPGVKVSTPLLPYLAVPGAAVAATILALAVARRRRRAKAASGRAAKPTVDWSFSFLAGNSVTFSPKLAPRFGSVFLGGRPWRRQRPWLR
jgi:hypothetical protein